MADHKFIHIETAYGMRADGPYHYLFYRIDRFFCERCLEAKDVRREESHRNSPDWWRAE